MPGPATRTGEIKSATTQLKSRVPNGVEGKRHSLGTRTTGSPKGLAEQNRRKKTECPKPDTHLNVQLQIWTPGRPNERSIYESALKDQVRRNWSL